MYHFAVTRAHLYLTQLKFDRKWYANVHCNLVNSINIKEMSYN